MINVFRHTATAVALCASASAPALAQSLPAPAAFSSASSGAGYRSAFEGYRRLTEEPVGDWKAANDKVAKIGGWRAYAREAGGSSPAPAPAAAASSGRKPHH